MAASITKNSILMSTLSLRLAIILLYSTSLISANNLLHCKDYQNRDCICPEDVVSFVCSVSGGLATIWRGSIFNCPNSGNQILLRHRNFENGVSGTCNDGEVVAYSSEIMSNNYSSQLHVIVSPEMHNGTVECIQWGAEASAGTCTLILTTEPPDDVHVSDINPNQLKIEWSLPRDNCPVVTYNILAATDCEIICPNTTTNTSIRCTNLTVDGQACSIVIQTKVCEHSSEYSGSASLTIVLKVPSAPEITSRWTNQFTSLLTSFNESEQFFISDGIDGSATNYTITYSDPSSGRTCDRVTIPASACTNGQCNHMFNIPFVCSNFNGIIITIFASNILGDGPLSVPILLEFKLENIIHFNESASDTTFLYSIMGAGSSIAVIVLVLLVTIMAIALSKFLRKFFRNNNHVKSREMESTGISNLITPSLDENINLKANECYELTGKSVTHKNTHNEIDKLLNLDTLLIQIRHEVTPKWYQFGLAVGINKETLDEFSNFTPEECIVEVSDLWLRTSVTTLTWRDVADALKECGYHKLAEKILKVYKTGILPIMSMEQSSMNDTAQ